jgi:transcription antitermination protein NusB
MKAARKDPRHRAREVALQILYHWEIGRTDVASAADTFFGLQWADPEPPSDEFRMFATELAHDTVRRLAEADALIAETAERWRPERMAVLDRLILRMAIAELLRGREQLNSGSDKAPPPAVIINEALELARTFSTEEAVKFINGMLDTVRKKLEGSGL